MRRLNVLMGIVWLAGLAPAAWTAPLEAGAAVEDITPTVPQRMSGYFHERVSTGTHDPLLVKAMVLRQGDVSAAIVTCDLIGIPESVTARIREGASGVTGIPSENIAIAATHTHTGPLYYGVFRDLFHERAVAAEGEDPHDPSPYVDQLVEQTVAAIAAAENALAPADMWTSNAREERLSFNRRFYLRDGSVRFNPGKLNPEIVAPAGPIDPEIPLLYMESAEDGAPLVLFHAFALHLDTVGGVEFAADYPYYAREILRDAVGEQLVTLFGMAPCGDINHIDVNHGAAQRGHGEAERIGRALAAVIQTALLAMTDGAPAEPGLAVASRVLDVPAQTYDAEELEWARDILEEVESPDIPFLDKTRARAVVDLHTRYGDTIAMEVQAVRLHNDAVFVFLPGEWFVDLSLHLKEASPFETTIVVSMANGAPGYVPTAQAFQEGSYETVNSRIAPGGAEEVLEEARRLLYGLKDW